MSQNIQEYIKTREQAIKDAESLIEQIKTDNYPNLLRLADINYFIDKTKAEINKLKESNNG